MGITRLSRDLLPYLESVTLGAKRTADQVHVRNLVLDGPSVVYHIYGRLAHVKAARSSVLDFPTYAELNGGVTAFLAGLEAADCRILRIYFDGALPVSKRPVRIERLERSRQTLAAWRVSYPELTISEARLSEGDIADAIWSSPSRSTNFTPPFIVPSVIERLWKSKWADSVALVPGEAEAYCVNYAAKYGAAILTNDSDMVVYPEFADGNVVLLHSLSLDASEEHRVIKGLCWRSRYIAGNIGVKDILTFAHSRLNNPTGSFANVVQQSKAPKDLAGFNDFRNQFKGLEEEGSFQTRLDNLDPRLSELICQMNPVYRNMASDAWQITLPILFEDAGRDSSWTYGRLFRNAAYNMLINVFATSKAHQIDLAIIEVQRKGERIIQDTVDTRMASDDLAVVMARLTDLSSQLSAKPKTRRNLILWALNLVMSEKEATGKTMPSQKLLDHYLKGKKLKPSRSNDDATAWTTAHLHANIQAVLYSLRMLQQVCQYLKDSDIDSMIGLRNIREILLAMSSEPDAMWTIAEVFISQQAATKMMSRYVQDSNDTTVRKTELPVGTGLILASR